MRSSKNSMGKVLALAMTIVILLPALSFANSELEDLERLIRIVNEAQSTPEKVTKFEERLIDYFGYAVSEESIKGAVKAYKPGEALVVVVLMKNSGKTEAEITELKKAGMDWDKIAERLNVPLKKVIRDIKGFRAAGC